MGKETSTTGERQSAGDHDQNAASSPFGRKERRLWLGAALALLLVIGVIIGVVIPLTTNNNKTSPSIDLMVTPTAVPPACTSLDTSLDCLAKGVSGAEALQDISSPQF
jgi:hypothetical protein